MYLSIFLDKYTAASFQVNCIIFLDQYAAGFFEINWITFLDKYTSPCFANELNYFLR